MFSEVENQFYMNNDKKTEEKGTQGVNASQTKGNDPKTNGQATAAKTNGATTTPKTEEKPAVPKVNGFKQKTIEEQMKFFDGLATLVNIKRRCETHKQAISDMSFPDEELTKFETEKRYGIRITLHGDDNDDYVINNPKLVKEVQTYLLNVIDGKIAEYDEKITLYGN